MDDLQNHLAKVGLNSDFPDAQENVDPAGLSSIFSPYDPQQRKWPDVVFVCLDCEAFEWDQEKVTEVGVAILDTRDTWDLEPSAPPEAIMEKVQGAHFRPTEYSRLANKKFVRGCPTAFGFGSSTWVRLVDTALILRRIFRNPTQMSDSARFDLEISDTQRDVIVVGHGLDNDDKYLRHLGFSISSVSNIIGNIDTQKIARPKPPIGLQALLSALSIDAVNLHNAGNDAVYTMQAFVKIAALASDEPGRLAELIRNVQVKPLGRYDLSIKASNTWEGSAIVGDEKLIGYREQHMVTSTQRSPLHSKQRPRSTLGRPKQVTAVYD
jgi:hypothetical protein